MTVFLSCIVVWGCALCRYIWSSYDGATKRLLMMLRESQLVVCQLGDNDFIGLISIELRHLNYVWLPVCIVGLCTVDLKFLSKSILIKALDRCTSDWYYGPVVLQCDDYPY